MTRSRRDVLVAGAFAALALVFLVEGRSLPFEARDIPGPGLFPFLLCLTILAFSAALLVTALRGSRREEQRVAPSDFELTPTALADESGLVSEDEDDAPRSLLRPLALWALVLAVCVGLPYLGFLPAMIILTLVLTVFMENRRDPMSLLAAVAVPAFFYFLFAILLEVRLPAGLFG